MLCIPWQTRGNDFIHSIQHTVWRTVSGKFAYFIFHARIVMKVLGIAHRLQNIELITLAHQQCVPLVQLR